MTAGQLHTRFKRVSWPFNASALMLVVALCWSGHAVANPNIATDPKTPEATAKIDASVKPFIGEFVSEKMRLVCRQAKNQLEGEIVRDDNILSFTASVSNSTLNGVFVDGNFKGTFAATFVDENLQVNFGISKFILKRFKRTPTQGHVAKQSEVLLATSEDHVPSTIVASSDNQKLAFVEFYQGQRHVVVNGDRGSPHFHIERPVISSDGRRIAFAAYEKKSWRVVLDEKPSEAYDAVAIRSLVFSPDSKRFAYASRIGESWHVTIDGKRGPSYAQVGMVEFSSDSKSVGYVALNDDRWHVVVNGKESPPESDILNRGLIFSPVGHRVAYVAQRESKRVVIVDGVESDLFDSVLGVGFSPDGKRTALHVQVGTQVLIVVDGKASQPCDRIEYMTFSPNSKRVAYKAALQGKQFVIVDGVQGAPFRQAGPPVFSPNGQSVAHAAQLDSGEVVAVVDGKPGKPYHWVDGITYSPDGKRVAYLAKYKNAWRVIVDGKSDELYSSVLGGRPIFSADGNVVVFGARRGNHDFVVVNGKEIAIRGRFLPSTKLVISESSIISALIKDGDKFKRLELKLK